MENSYGRPTAFNFPIGGNYQRLAHVLLKRNPQSHRRIIQKAFIINSKIN
jgi:hypothetical protein